MRVRGHTFWAIALPRSACRGASRGARASLWRHEERTGASGKGQIDTSVKRNRALRSRSFRLWVQGSTSRSSRFRGTAARRSRARVASRLGLGLNCEHSNTHRPDAGLRWGGQARIFNTLWYNARSVIAMCASSNMHVSDRVMPCSPVRSWRSITRPFPGPVIARARRNFAGSQHWHSPRLHPWPPVGSQPPARPLRPAKRPCGQRAAPT